MLRALLYLALLVHVSVAAESTGNTATQIAAAKSQPSTTTPLLSAILANEDEEKEIVVGDIIAAKAALDAGANVNERNTTFNDTPLLRAAMLGQMQMVRLLLRHGADPNAKGADDWTPLMWAARNTKAGTEADIVLELLEAGASVLDRSKIGYTPLHVAASHGNVSATHGAFSAYVPDLVLPPPDLPPFLLILTTALSYKFAACDANDAR